MKQTEVTRTQNTQRRNHTICKNYDDINLKNKVKKITRTQNTTKKSHKLITPTQNKDEGRNHEQNTKLCRISPKWSRMRRHKDTMNHKSQKQNTQRRDIL